MLESFLNLAIGGFYGGTIGNLLASWEQAGVFTYVLPFLLIFAIVFGIMSKIGIFGDNKGLNAVIALVIGLLALQFELVPVFFSEIFPRVGVGLSILLVLIILVGLFFSKENNYMINFLLLAAALVTFLVVLTKATGTLGWYSGYWWRENWPSILTGLLIVGAMAAVINFGTKKPDPLNRNFVP